MPKLVVLGTANAIPNENHENTHMAVASGDRFVLIDCVGSPIVRLRKAGLDVHHLSDLVLTHFHPDHMSGVPSLLMGSWLLGRKQPLNIYGLPYTLERVEKLMEFFEWKSWPNFYPVQFCPLEAKELFPVRIDEDFHIYSSPVRHMIPNIGLRFESPRTGGVVAYSCDTAPCKEVVHLARGANYLLHEATGSSHGHSSAADAGDIARQAEVKTLVLIHYDADDPAPGRLIDQARQTFDGPVILAEDFMELAF